MKILYLSSSDLKGGAARGAYRLHRGLLQAGVRSQMLVRTKISNDPSVATIDESIATRAVHRVRRGLAKGVKRMMPSDRGGYRSLNLIPTALAGHINRSDADIVQIHWIGDDAVAIADLGRIEKPIVWRLADMWAFCGTEHYTTSSRYREGYLRSNREPGATGPDIDRIAWGAKRSAWQHLSMTVVTPSRWLADCVRASALLGDRRTEVIPNGLDLELFRPVDPRSARRELGLPEDRRLVLFGAVDATSDPRKGYHLLQRALDEVALDADRSQDTDLVVFGAEPESRDGRALPTHHLGRFTDDERLRLCYSAADLFVAPSLQDNLPFTVMEAMACGTPCVAFDIGGMGDMVTDGIDGHLVAPFDPTALARCIVDALADRDRLQQMRRAARDASCTRFGIERQVQCYLELYRSVLEGEAA